MTTLAQAPKEEVQQVLRDAAEIIHEKGWAKGVFYDSEGRVCALGAIHLAASRRLGISAHRDGAPVSAADALELATLAHHALRAHLKARGDLDVIGVPSWNDYVAKDADEVCEAFKLAAESLEDK